MRATWPRHARGVRVAVITETFLPHVNGVTNSVLRVLEHLQATGHQAVVVAPSFAGQAPSEHAGHPVIGLPSVGLPGYPDFRVAASTRPRVERILRRFAPDVVHLASPFALGQQAAQVARRMGLPIVAVYQTEVPTFASRYGLPQVEPALWAWVRRIHNCATLPLAPSRFAIDQLRSHGVRRVEHWGRGVDTTRFHPGRAAPAWRRAVAPNGEKIVLYVGRLAAEKQLTDLAVLSDLPGVRLVLIGDGPRRAELAERLPGAVFLGQQTGAAVPTAMASADLFVHTGELETFCQSIQEAMASGTPVVAPGRGGPLDLVDPSRTGWLYAPGDLAALRSHVRDLLGDDAKRQAFGVAARSAVEGRTWPAVCAQLVDRYHAAVERQLAFSA